MTETKGSVVPHEYIDAATGTPVPVGMAIPAVHRGWLPASIRLVEWLRDTAAEGRTASVVFGSRDPLFNINSLNFTSLLFLDRPAYAASSRPTSAATTPRPIAVNSTNWRPMSS